MKQTKLSVVQSFNCRPEAYLVRGALEDAGIPAIIQADTAGGMREHLAWSGAGFKILVREEDVTAAHELLHSLPDAEIPEDFSDRDPLPPWRKFT